MLDTIRENPKLKGIAIRACSLIILFAGLFLPFANGITMTVESSSKVVTTYHTAFSFIFGGRLVSEHATYSVKGISVVALLAYIFLLFSCLFLAASFFFIRNRRKTAALLVLLSTIIGIASAIMVFSSHSDVARVLADSIIKGHSDSVTNTIIEHTTLGFGLLGFGVFELVAVFGEIISLFVDGTFDYIKAVLESR